MYERRPYGRSVTGLTISGICWQILKTKDGLGMRYENITRTELIMLNAYKRTIDLISENNYLCKKCKKYIVINGKCPKCDNQIRK